LIQVKRSRGDFWQTIKKLTDQTSAMSLHKEILKWQAAHPNITWIGWGIVWGIVLAILFWPRKTG